MYRTTPVNPIAIFVYAATGSLTRIYGGCILNEYLSGTIKDEDRQVLSQMQKKQVVESFLQV